MNREHPIAEIGAGPIGVAAVAHLIERNQQVRVLEAASAVGTVIRPWGHLRLFSIWR